MYDIKCLANLRETKMVNEDNDSSKIKVDLVRSWQWMCPNCGTDNHEVGTSATMSEEEKIKARHELGIPDGVEGEFVMAPMNVICRICNSSFDTNEPPMSA